MRTRICGPQVLFSLDSAVELAGPLRADPADVISYDGSAYAIVFDASSQGIHGGVGVDAVAVAGGDLALSFDTTVSIDGERIAAGGGSLVLDNRISRVASGPAIVASETIVRGNTALGFTSAFSAIGCTDCVVGGNVVRNHNSFGLSAGGATIYGGKHYSICP